MTYMYINAKNYPFWYLVGLYIFGLKITYQLNSNLTIKKMKHNFLKHKRKRYLFRYFRTGLRLTFLLYLIH